MTSDEIRQGIRNDLTQGDVSRLPLWEIAYQLAVLNERNECPTCAHVDEPWQGDQTRWKGLYQDFGPPAGADSQTGTQDDNIPWTQDECIAADERAKGKADERTTPLESDTNLPSTSKESL